MSLFVYLCIQHSFQTYYKPYALQDAEYTKMNEQVTLKLKDKEKYPICIQEEKMGNIKKWNPNNLRIFLQNSKRQRQWSNL